VTDEELNRKFDRIENQIEVLTESLDRMEQAQLADRQRFDEAQAKADARIARLERIAMMTLRAGDRERKSLRSSLRAVSDAQAVTERNLSLMVEHFDRKTDAQITMQDQAAEKFAALTTAQQRSEAKIEALAESQQRLEEVVIRLAGSQSEMQDAMREMAQAITRTSQRVDALESNNGNS
jgi:chromosome segregation ATPase